jgi:hypothetical protein
LATCAIGVGAVGVKLTFATLLDPVQPRLRAAPVA